MDGMIVNSQAWWFLRGLADQIDTELLAGTDPSALAEAALNALDTALGLVPRGRPLPSITEQESPL